MHTVADPRRRRPVLRVLTAVLVPLATLSAVGASTVAGAGPVGAASVPSCPLGTLAKSKGPVTITFWNSAVRANLTTLQNITNAFNAAQKKVKVVLVQQSSYDDTWNKYEAGLSTGQLPALAMLEDVRTQEAVDTRSFLPMQACMSATHYPTADFIPRVLAYWKTNGIQQGLPFAVSNPVFYYNKLAFQKAGLNPNAPPATLPQLLADARILKQAGSGMGLVLDPWHLATWLATANNLFVNNNNGRTGRATKAAFNTPRGLQIWTELKQLVTSGDATTNPATGPDAFDNLLGIGSGKYAMTIDTSADLGTITQVLASGSYPNVKIGVSAFPVLSASLPGGIEPGGSGIWISNKVPPAQQAAAWVFATWLDNTTNQAKWAAGTGYIPIRRSSTLTPLVQQLWATNPGYKVAYTQLNTGVNSYATAGAVIGPYADVNTAILNAEESMYTSGVSPKAALNTASQQVNQIIGQYNQRLGVS
ncbi:MAG TPA: ABC transporter substrate-binding protein [Acidimicrobiales bacterium]|nr:ABC transporter substrate-binding protein [Acidimicrobiales bacterium]